MIVYEEYVFESHARSRFRFVFVSFSLASVHGRFGI